MVTYLDEATNYVDGKKVMQWIMQEIGGNVPTPFYNEFNISMYKRGKPMGFYVADKLLTKLGLHICDMPTEFYLTFQEARPNNSTPNQRRKNAKRTR